MTDNCFPEPGCSDWGASESAPAGERRSSRSRLLISLESPRPCRPAIHIETKWRQPDVLRDVDPRNPRLIVSRWQGRDLREHSCEIRGEHHVLAVTMQPSRFSLSIGQQSYPVKEVDAGTVQISPPGEVARILYFSSFDVLHLYVPNPLLAECYDWYHGRRPTNGVVLRDPHFARDMPAQRLAATLLSIADNDDACCGLVADFLGLAIVTRLLGLYGDSAPPASGRANPLSKWRLRRALDFMEANLDRPVALADLAGAAGLSRMHFAAQFRVATGLRPHEYMLRRRIEKAQRLLETTDEPIAELALNVGFSSQAHFTTVFKRFSGLTPLRWRKRERL